MNQLKTYFLALERLRIDVSFICAPCNYQSKLLSDIASASFSAASFNTFCKIVQKNKEKTKVAEVVNNIEDETEYKQMLELVQQDPEIAIYQKEQEDIQNKCDLLIKHLTQATQDKLQDLKNN